MVGRKGSSGGGGRGGLGGEAELEHHRSIPRGHARASLSPVVWIGGRGADTELQCIGAGTGRWFAAGVGLQRSSQQYPLHQPFH